MLGVFVFKQIGRDKVDTVEEFRDEMGDTMKHI